MGLRDTIRKAASTAVKATGDLSKVNSVTYKQLVEAEYNTSTGQVVSNTNVYQNLTMTIVDFDRKFIDGENIRDTDQRGLLPALDPLTGIDIGFIPDAGGDTVEFVNENNILELWDVVNVRKDPASALYDLQLRKRE